MKRHLEPKLALVVLAIPLLLVSATGVTAVAANPPPVPPFSIYGTPTPPSYSPILNATGEYWGPYVNTIYFTWFTTSEAVIEALINGYIQYDEAGVSTIQEYNQLEAYAQSGQIGLNYTPYNGFEFIGFDYNAYPFNNVHFRRAIQHLINYQELSAALYNGILGIASPFYLDPSVYPTYFTSAQLNAYRQYGGFNTTAAVVELQEAGLVDHSSQGYWTFPNGTVANFIIYYSTGTAQDLLIRELDVLVTAAASINLSITITPVNFVTLVYSLMFNREAPMYIIGFSFGPPAVPTSWRESLGPTPINEYFIGYTNSTGWKLLNQLFSDSSTMQLAQNYANQMAVYFQETVPLVVLNWFTTLTPVNTLNWRGNILDPGYPGFVFPGDVHPANSTFGTLYRYGLGDSLSNPNIYTTVDSYDYEFLSVQWITALQLSYSTTSELAPWAAYNWTMQRGAGMMPNGHYYNGSTLTMHFIPDMVWQDGAPFTAIDFNFSLWYFDVAGYTSNPYNSSLDTVTYSPGVVFNYTAEVNSPSGVWFDISPNLVGSYVPPNNPDTITLFFNSSSIFNLYSPFGVWNLPILPEHVFSNITPKTYSNEPASDYLRQQVMAGPYMFDSWSITANYGTVKYFPSYFLANPYVNYLTGHRGSTVEFVLNATVYNQSLFQSTTSSYAAGFSQVSNAQGEVYVLNMSTQTPVESYALSNAGNGVYTATLNLASLEPGTYLLVSQVNWTGQPYYYFYGNGSTMQNEYSYHEYGVLVVTSAPSSSYSQSPSTTSSVTSSVYGPSPGGTSSQSSTVPPKGFNPAVLLAVLVVIIVAVVLSTWVLRNRSRQPRA
jgi:ABC-type transport system substrate-binding protein